MLHTPRLSPDGRRMGFFFVFFVFSSSSFFLRGLFTSETEEYHVKLRVMTTIRGITINLQR